MPDVVCTVCGGKDFYNEAGFYYCSECQTQTQELREHVFVQQENTFHLKTDKTRVRKTREPGQHKITSWETFNYIMVGLADEMVSLGASQKFRFICCRLWLMYLSKLEIMGKTPGGRPKLNACYKKRDAEIVYNKKARRRNDEKPTVVVEAESFVEAKLLRKERNKQQRRLFKKDYDKLSNQKGDEGLQNRTLESLHSEAESDGEGKNVMIFSAAAKKELLKHMTAKHLKLHMLDLNNTLSCHKMSQLVVTPSYSHGPSLITRVKLYGIINLALLLTEDKHQLSDLLRFCREGNLSFLDYKHFFPEEHAEAIDESVYSKGVQCLNSYSNIQKVTWDMFKFLGLPECNFRPDLNALCKRFCYELNLPDEICNMALHLIRESNPQFPPNPKWQRVPNYEGRILCIIIFVIKLLYGLDGKTEIHLSKFAKLLNARKQKKPVDMFVWDEWYCYIERRKSILKLTHFPTKYLLDPEGTESDNLFCDFIFNRFQRKNIEQKNILSMSIVQKYLKDLNSLQEMPLNNYIDFPVTLTPFRTYIETLKKTANFKINDEKVDLDSLKNFANCSIGFLMHPSKYLKSIHAHDCTVVMGGANTKVEFMKLRNLQVEQFPEIVEKYEKQWEYAFGQIKEDHLQFDDLLDKILDKHIENVSRPPVDDVTLTAHEKETVTKNKKGKRKKGHDEDWSVSKKNKNPKLEEHIYNPSLLYQVKKEVEEKIAKATEQEKLPNNDAYPIHYIPRYDFWINIQEFGYWSVERWEKYFSSMPPNFRWLIEQCSLLVEQKPHELFNEYVTVEAYLIYIHYKHKPVYFKPYCNYSEMMKLARKAQKAW